MDPNSAPHLRTLTGPDIHSWSTDSEAIFATNCYPVPGPHRVAHRVAHLPRRYSDSQTLLFPHSDTFNRFANVYERITNSSAFGCPHYRAKRETDPSTNKPTNKQPNPDPD